MENSEQNPSQTAQTEDKDQNGVQRIALQDGLKYNNESFSPHENFRPDGSYRLDFTGRRFGCCVGGYFKADGPADEEFAGKMLGTHSSNDPNSGSYVMGVRLDGTRVRLRKEIHPDYTDTLKEENLSDIGDLRKKWIGLQFLKINRNDQVICQTYVDTAGLDANDAPQNKWRKIFEIVDDGNIAPEEYKKVWLVPSKGPDKTQNTIRVDEQSGNSFSYKFAFAREIIEG